jgi:lipopolysaccharide transport system ATP-binding protein
MADIAIRAQGLSKSYHVYASQRARLVHALWPSHSGGMQEIWALRDVDFEVARGESVGVIGRNGGGKSTLLEILAGTLRPTTGEAHVTGRVSALLELGSGFNPEYTGRDNVLVNGLLLGLQREEILRRFDEILEFAEIGDAIDRPVKTYSSGMVMRLAFAVQVLSDPEVLIVDEALSVGDFFFQQKCFRRIRELTERGITLLFVSHDMRTVRDLCTRAIYLRAGRAVFVGEAKTAVRMYLNEEAGPPAGVSAPQVQAGGGSHALPATPLWRGSDDGPLLAVDVVDAQGRAATGGRIGDTLTVRVYFRAAPSAAGHVVLVLKNRYDQVVTSVGSYVNGLPAMSSGDADFAVFEVDIDLMLEAGLYSLKVAFSRPTGSNVGETAGDSGWLGPLAVEWDYQRQTAPFLGMFGVPYRCRLADAHAAESAQ